MISGEALLTLFRFSLIGLSVGVVIIALCSGNAVKFLQEANFVLIPLAVIAFIVAFL